MKRNLDLARQLLFDIENRGADCSTSSLRHAPNDQREEQVRYHLRLLLDGGFLREVDRTSEGVPCVRLTHEGHELLELARSDTRWREAKRVCWEQSGGFSLKTITRLLAHWTMGDAVRTASHQVGRQRHDPAAWRYQVAAPRATSVDKPPFDPWTGRRIVADRCLAENSAEPDVHYVRVRPSYMDLENLDRPDRYGVDLNGDGLVDVEVDAVPNDAIL